jgi:ribosomal protein S16
MQTKIIRLKRRGAKKNAFFEIIITFKKRRGNGSGLEEKLGFISPKGERSIAINCERLGF